MKKLICAITLCAFALPSSAAFARAETPAAEPDQAREPAAVLYLYDDGTFQRYAPAGDGETVLDLAGVYTLSGGAGEEDAVLTIGGARDAEESPTPQPAAPSPVVYYEGGQAYIDEGTDTGIEITGYTQYGGGPESYFLSAGDKVAVISPSALPGAEQTAATVEGLRGWGFEPVEGKYVCPETRTLEECLADLRWALEDPEIKAVFCVRGGYGATEVMDALPEELIASAGKPIIGYSDITACHAAWTRAGLPSVHACMSAAFGDFPAECAEAQVRMMQGEMPVYRCRADAYCREGSAEGVLIGGNLSTFTATLDTAYDSTALSRPYILFLEEVGENMQHIHRYLTILKHKGVLDNAAGIVFGEWTELPADGTGNYGEARGGLFASVADMICRQFLDGTDIPVAFGFPSGHGDVNYPLLLGAAAKLEVSGEGYTLSWPEA